ncbi:ATP-binding protein [Limnospira fusiformis]|uniref:ATP-binding protein n=1 Tax=Limnospira fusiformis TaxID=54297 RepID=UPI001449FB79|nr:ATP-binding protein [Limnospira fusiformis SAG 85.79]
MINTVKQHKFFLEVTALLSVGSVVTGYTKAATPFYTHFSGPTVNSITASKLLDFAKKLGEQSPGLSKEKLAKSVGGAIALGLLQIAQKKTYQHIARELKHLAKHTQQYWLQIEHSSEGIADYEAIGEHHLRYTLAANGSDIFLKTLDLQSWEHLITWLMEQHKSHLSHGIHYYQDAIKAISKHLHKRFAHNLTEIWKQDAAKGGKVFHSMVLDLLRDGQTSAHKIAITQQDILTILKQLNTGLQDKLESIQEALEPYFDQSKTPFTISPQCESIIADTTKYFVGRTHVFEAIKEFLEKEPPGYFVLEADPGYGKTSILARCVQLFEGHCLSYFNSQSLGKVTARQFLENICTELIEYYQLDYTSLPENALRNGKVLSRLLKEASQKLPRGKKLVVVVDALNEVDLSSQTPGSNVLYLPDKLPENVYFIISKRDEKLPLPVSDNKTICNLRQYRSESAWDAGKYTNKRLSQSRFIQQWMASQKLTSEQFCTQLVAKSENNFMYLRYVLNDIHNGVYNGKTLASLPIGLWGYYKHHWQMLRINHKSLPMAQIRAIYVLSKVREPVSCRLLAKLTGVEESVLSTFLEQWDQFLQVQIIDNETRYSIYHGSFHDFLEKQSADSGVNLEELKRGIVENLAKGAPL